MTIQVKDNLTRQYDLIGDLIQEARNARTWLTKMEELAETLDEATPEGDDVIVNTSKRVGSFVAVTLEVETEEKPNAITAIMENYEWDNANLERKNGEWRIYLKRRYTYS